jgi:hypothetical protein
MYIILLTSNSCVKTNLRDAEDERAAEKPVFGRNLRNLKERNYDVKQQSIMWVVVYKLIGCKNLIGRQIQAL